MSDEMGILRVEAEVEPREESDRRVRFSDVLVDTGSELSWFPASSLDEIGVRRSRRLSFRQATGTVVERWTGNAVVHAAGFSVADRVVFGEPGDLMLLGSRTLEGLNLMVDPVNRRLVDAGALPAAAA
jgi:predicted aspartyl protease